MVVVRGVAEADEQETRPVFFLLAGEAAFAGLFTPLVLLPLLFFFGLVERDGRLVTVRWLGWSDSLESFFGIVLGIGLVYGLTFAVVEWLGIRQRARLASVVSLLAPVAWVWTAKFADKLFENPDSLVAFEKTVLNTSVNDLFMASLLAFWASWVTGPLLACRRQHGDTIEQCGASALGCLVAITAFECAFATARSNGGVHLFAFVLFLVAVVFPLGLACGRRPAHALLRVVEQRWEPVASSDMWTRLRSLWALDAVLVGGLITFAGGGLFTGLSEHTNGGGELFALEEFALLALAAHLVLHVDMGRRAATLPPLLGPRGTLAAWVGLAVTGVLPLVEAQHAEGHLELRYSLPIAIILAVCGLRWLRGDESPERA